MINPLQPRHEYTKEEEKSVQEDSVILTLHFVLVGVLGGSAVASRQKRLRFG